jgi:hypothetical protein
MHTLWCSGDEGGVPYRPSTIRPESAMDSGRVFLLIMSVAQNPLIVCKLSLAEDGTKGQWTKVMGNKTGIKGLGD